MPPTCFSLSLSLCLTEREREEGWQAGYVSAGYHPYKIILTEVALGQTVRRGRGDRDGMGKPQRRCASAGISQSDPGGLEAGRHRLLKRLTQGVLFGYKADVHVSRAAMRA